MIKKFGILVLLCVMAGATALAQHGYTLTKVGEKFGEGYGTIAYIGHFKGKHFFYATQGNKLDLLGFDLATNRLDKYSPAELTIGSGILIQGAAVIGGRVVITLMETRGNAQGRMFSFKLGEQIDIEKMVVTDPKMRFFADRKSARIACFQKDIDEGLKGVSVKYYTPLLEESAGNQFAEYPKPVSKHSKFEMMEIDNEGQPSLLYHLFTPNKPGGYLGAYSFLLRKYLKNETFQDFVFDMRSEFYSDVLVSQLDPNTLGIATYTMTTGTYSDWWAKGLNIATYDLKTGAMLAKKEIVFNKDPKFATVDQEFTMRPMWPAQLLAFPDGYLLVGQQVSPLSMKKSCSLHLCFLDKQLNRKWQEILVVPQYLPQQEHPRHTLGSTKVYFPKFSSIPTEDGATIIFEDFFPNKQTSYAPSDKGKATELNAMSPFAKNGTVAWVHATTSGNLTAGSVVHAEHPDFVLDHDITHRLEDGSYLTLLRYLDGGVQFATISGN